MTGLSGRVGILGSRLYYRDANRQRLLTAAEDRAIAGTR